jgi:RNA polymerase sigma factor (TIGR02999 family)
MTSPTPSAVTMILRAAAQGDPQAAAELLPLVYDELRRLAQSRLRQTPPGNTLQPTALVHEAYLKLLGSGAGDQSWDGRAHFFGAAARAMRDILVDQARRKAAAKHGAGRRRVDLDGLELSGGDADPDDRAQGILDLDAAIRRLETQDPGGRRAEIVMLRCFAGLSESETAAALSLTDRTIRREWRFIKAWLLRELESTGEGPAKWPNSKGPNGK